MINKSHSESSALKEKKTIALSDDNNVNERALSEHNVICQKEKIRNKNTIATARNVTFKEGSPDIFFVSQQNQSVVDENLNSSNCFSTNDSYDSFKVTSDQNHTCDSPPSSPLKTNAVANEGSSPNSTDKKNEIDTHKEHESNSGSHIISSNIQLPGTLESVCLSPINKPLRPDATRRSSKDNEVDDDIFSEIDQEDLSAVAAMKDSDINSTSLLKSISLSHIAANTEIGNKQFFKEDGKIFRPHLGGGKVLNSGVQPVAAGACVLLVVNTGFQLWKFTECDDSYYKADDHPFDWSDCNLDT